MEARVSSVDTIVRLGDVTEGVFVSLRAEHDEMWTVGNSVEEAVRGEIRNPMCAHRRNPADRPWYDERLEWVVFQPMLILDGVVEHGGSRWRTDVGEFDRELERDEIFFVKVEP